MPAFQKNHLFLMLFFILLSDGLLAGFDDDVIVQEVSLNYMNQEILDGTIAMDCSSQDGICRSIFEFKPNGAYQNNGSKVLIRELKFQGLFYRDSSNSSELGAITVQRDNKSTQLPVSIDYQQLPPSDRENAVTRALIAQFHPSLIDQAVKELEQSTEISDYLIGATKNSETLHLFKPESHTLSGENANTLNQSINSEFLVLDMGDSYSMVIIFDQGNMPKSIYVLDRWRLYRNPLVKSVIGYGDLVGLVLHGMDFIGHSQSMLGLGKQADHAVHFATLERLALSIGVGHAALSRLTAFIGAGFHIAEIVDHTQGVGEFISGSQKHYHDHHHGLWGDIFGVMHLAHTFFELAMDRSLSHSIQMFLTVASFAYHHIPHRYYEYPMSDVIQPVIVSRNKLPVDAE